MNEFFEHIGADLKEIGNQIKGFFAKIMGKQAPSTQSGSVINTNVKTNYEINLVPEVKMQMIKAQKMRNLVLFICIVVSSVAVGAVVVLFGIKSGQDIAISSQDKKLEMMSEKLNSYSELNNLITIQGQLEGISNIIGQKTVLSRVFGALGVMLPQGADTVQLSELSVSLDSNTIRMEGQADAHIDPLIDYRVLESFKKGVALTKYDYGNYVDADGNQLPTHCIQETDADGNAYKSGDSYYAWWDLQIEGCEGSRLGGHTVEGAKYHYSSTAEVEEGIPGEEPVMEEVCDENGENCTMQPVVPETPPEGEGEGEEAEEEENKIVPLRVKIWRTPQFNTWYEAQRMSLDGSIANVEHFESQCITYRGTHGSDRIRWTSTNDCMLAPDGFIVESSSNGRDASDNLVLKFTGTTVLAEDFFMFKNKHMIAIGPLGQNVTDSYVQIGNMFTKEAEDCDPDDTECLNNANNRGEK